MFTRLNPQPFRWARYVAAFTAVAAGTTVGAAVTAADAAPDLGTATNAAVTVTRDCTHLNVTVTNQWDYRLDGLFSSSVDYGFEFHLTPGQSMTHSADMAGHPEPIRFTAFATFSNGAVAHITYNPASQTATDPAGCVPPSTSPPLASVPPPPPPVYPSTPATAVTSPPASDTVTSISPPTSVPASTAGAAGHPTTISYQLPVTGAEQDFIVITVVAGSALIILGSVALMARSRGRD